MIKFSYDSWHGIVLHKLSPYNLGNVRSICQLVRRLLITMFIIWPVAVSSVSVFAGWILTAIGMDLRILFGFSHWNEKAWWYGSTVAFNILSTLIAAVVACGYIKYLSDERKWKRMYDEDGNVIPRKPKEPGLIKTYLKAIKDKICPLVSYE